MCVDRKQHVNAPRNIGRNSWPARARMALVGNGRRGVLVAASAGAGLISAAAATPSIAQSAGSVALGLPDGGITDRAYVTAPPNWFFVIERGAGSFLDCGDGMDDGQTDEAGRAMTALQCSVTLTETIFVPAAAASARVTVHY